MAKTATRRPEENREYDFAEYLKEFAPATVRKSSDESNDQVFDPIVIGSQMADETIRILRRGREPNSKPRA